GRARPAGPVRWHRSRWRDPARPVRGRRGQRLRRWGRARQQRARGYLPGRLSVLRPRGRPWEPGGPAMSRDARALVVTGSVGGGKTTVIDAIGDVLAERGGSEAARDTGWLGRGPPAP